jgi:2-hydroxy-6-oxonona-2,4-dienedioate hydrolase
MRAIDDDVPAFVRAEMSENGIYGGWSRTGGHRLYVRVPSWLKQNGDELDSGPTPIVLVHGIGASSRVMKRMIAELGSAYPVFAPDLLGFGMSDEPARLLDAEGHAEALRKWMVTTGIDDAAILGTSYGCQVALELAIRDPERVDRLILSGPTFDADARDAGVQLRRWLRNAWRESPFLAPHVVRDILDCGPWRVQRTLELALGELIEEKLPRVEAPTLVVRGERDPIVPQAWAERVTELLPDGELRVIPKAGHALHFSAASQLAGLVDEFVQLGDRMVALDGDRSDG